MFKVWLMIEEQVGDDHLDVQGYVYSLSGQEHETLLAAVEEIQRAVALAGQRATDDIEQDIAGLKRAKADRR